MYKHSLKSNMNQTATVWLTGVTVTSMETKSRKESNRSFTLMNVAFYALNIPYFIKIIMLYTL